MNAIAFIIPSPSAFTSGFHIFLESDSIRLCFMYYDLFTNKDEQVLVLHPQTKGTAEAQKMPAMPANMSHRQPGILDQVHSGWLYSRSIH